MTEFLTSNEWYYRLGRTIVQGVLAAIATNIDLIMGTVVFDVEWRALATVIVMAVLSPVMALLGEIEVPGEGVDGGH
ncbi:hypothetical protein B5F74_02200 [Collinsella sp. An271]|uniref:hypothetical protein n=1 Tax=Collinsella sp. An271 TaxID=1965616 RepID=UPI000B39EBD7|nr:hypothetical protein [Collinsella sp. An271]OUO62044.1 hypothetical protein B5F74_02200 [Collinsella sp. An271]